MERLQSGRFLRFHRGVSKAHSFCVSINLLVFALNKASHINLASNLGSGGGRRKRTKYDDDVESNHSYSLRSRGYYLIFH